MNTAIVCLALVSLVTGIPEPPPTFSFAIDGPEEERVKNVHIYRDGHHWAITSEKKEFEVMGKMTPAMHVRVVLNDEDRSFHMITEQSCEKAQLNFDPHMMFLPYYDETSDTTKINSYTLGVGAHQLHVDVWKIVNHPHEEEEEEEGVEKSEKDRTSYVFVQNHDKYAIPVMRINSNNTAMVIENFKLHADPKVFHIPSDCKDMATKELERSVMDLMK